ncbi:hypothetical protein PTSG_04443 [Salpingoeca rosetta]|uniref:Uncharacterized protein n=1 Tax=Salpingoeca rosetta (strain ATCC 50818 / BSB-021) TaxID=946362 RepID=F2U8K7_SALR5|nr:uncharacterized protein PTSG_04443 [Salpingoeca rosetta]EGD72715.1 hypothetical protein PTSG_04443 [Salpingoeca rosetta]|eukprot:XP_004994538.1 hypothetical protein PTSG_04443 [Salpingoeca rosetta]
MFKMPPKMLLGLSRLLQQAHLGLLLLAALAVAQHGRSTGAVVTSRRVHDSCGHFPVANITTVSSNATAVIYNGTRVAVTTGALVAGKDLIVVADTCIINSGNYTSPGRNIVLLCNDVLQVQGAVQFNVNGEAGSTNKPGGNAGNIVISARKTSEDGKQGGTGTPGTNGGAGGNGGQVRITAISANSTVVSVSGGHGGQGGKGGPGGAGGQGGKGGLAFIHTCCLDLLGCHCHCNQDHSCGDGKPGSQGATGLSGADGQNGSPGHDGSYQFIACSGAASVVHDIDVTC